MIDISLYATYTCGNNPSNDPIADMTKKTKKEIVKTICKEVDHLFPKKGITQLQTKEIVQKTFDAIVDILVEEGRIELRKFGVFQVKKRAARKARNPRTGEKVDVAEKFVVTFKPGKEMEERVRAMEEAEARRKAALAAGELESNDPSVAELPEPRVSDSVASEAPQTPLAIDPLVDPTTPTDPSVQ